MTRAVKWRGVRWIWPVRGMCPKHKIPVGPFTGLCIKCHREQLAAAKSGSNEWEREQ